MRIENDKYYTPFDIAKKCFDKTIEIVGYDNITEIIEPSAGNGSFSSQWPFCIAYDIEPEHPDIIKQDFLALDIPYKKGRLFIGNPPFGLRMSLANKFYKKCIQLGDYIAFILPIGQLNNSAVLYDFDLIYSEDLGEQLYTDRYLHCCFNIYRRPEKGLNSSPNHKLKDITIIRQDHKNYEAIENYDIRMCYWGNGSAGKILSPEEKKYAGEYKILIHNESIKDKIKEVIYTTEWKKELNFIAMMRIKQYDIYNILKREIPEIK